MRHNKRYGRNSLSNAPSVCKYKHDTLNKTSRTKQVWYTGIEAGLSGSGLVDHVEDHEEARAEDWIVGEMGALSVFHSQTTIKRLREGLLPTSLPTSKQ